MDNDVLSVLGPLVALFFVLFALACMVFAVWVWMRIVGRTGHNQWLGLLMVVPIANLILLLILAFGDWPIHREMEMLRRQIASVRAPM